MTSIRYQLRFRIERIVLFYRVHRDAYTLFFTLRRLEGNLGKHMRYLESIGAPIPPDLTVIREQMARPLRKIIDGTNDLW